jgi:undecaprenyl-diphosphatase
MKRLVQFKETTLTILVIIFLYVILLFFGVVQAYLSHNSLILADTRIANLLYAFQNDNLLHIFYFITLFAEPIVIIILSVMFSILLWVRRQRIYMFSFWFVLVLGEGLVFLGKYIFQRERPDLFMRAITENSFSFPSGHAIVVVLFYGFLVYLIIRSYASFKIKTAVSIIFVLLVALVDFSRLYLGVHYLSDVWASNLLGFSVLILSIIITEWVIYRKPDLLPDKIKPSQIWIVLIVAVASVLLVYNLTDSPVGKDKPIIVQKINS